MASAGSFGVLCLSRLLLSLASSAGTLRAQAPAAAARPVAATARAEIIAGRVTTDSGVALPGAQVFVTRGPDRALQTTTSAADGRWSVRFAEGWGDYLVYVTAVGRKGVTRRVTRGGAGLPALDSPDSVFVVNTALAAAITQLEQVTVTAEPKTRVERLVRSPASEPQAGAAERWVDDFTGNVPPDQAGNLAALAATTPGVVPTAAGVSALGLGAGQTRATLGGLQFTGAELPRDARTFTRVSTSTYDPSRGWFGGAEIAVELSPGSAFQASRGHLTLDAPALQVTDPVGTQLGQRFTNLQASYGNEGGLADDRIAYNVGLQGGRRTQDAASLFGAAPGALLAAGLAADSAARLASVLSAAGVPVRAGGATMRTTDQLSFVGRIGNPYYDYNKFEPVSRIAGVTAFGNWRRSQAFGVLPTATATRAGELRRASAGIQGLYSAYVTKRNWLVEARSGLSASNESSTPYLALPGALVLVGGAGSAAVTQPGSTASPGLVPVAFGGNGALLAQRRDWLWETQGSFAFYDPDRSQHQFTVAADVRLDGLSDMPGADRFGTFVYRSIADVAARQPASFTRALAIPAGSARVWNAFISAGDEWRVSPALQLLYGVRVEGTAYATRPAYNSALDRELGVRTDRAPGRVAVSPRFGFTWRRTAAEDGYTMGRFGSFRIPYASVVRGGVGMFRDLLGPDLAASAAAATGLPGSSTRLVCTGSAVPSLDWTAWSTGAVPIPSACAGGVGGVLADSAPGVIALDRRYDAPRSWRANLARSGVRWNTVYNIEGIYSLNLRQPGTLDANFAGIPQFTLSGEGRPVYVPRSDIIPATGALAQTGARRSAEFGRVALYRSDLRSVSRQLAITLSPYGANLRQWWASGSYVLGSVRQQAYGFDGGAFGDPRARTWSRGNLDVRHQFLLQAGVGVGSVTTTLFGRVASGLPYTPLVGSDINGDGLVNDRAFVSDPAAPSSDPGVAQAMRALLAGAPAPARECLARTLGRAAERNACTGPWTAMVNARVAMSGKVLRLGERTTIALNFTNPLAGIDQLLHGSRLRGWGQPALPDPVLLQVRGFDPATSSYRYAVNPRFGDTRPAATAWRVPFVVTLDIAFDLAPPLPEQQLGKWLSPGRRGRPGPRLTLADLMKRYTRNTPDPYGAILKAGDSLLLTRVQVESLQEARASYRARTDSVWATLGEYLAALGDDYDVAASTRRQSAAADSVWEIARADVRSKLPTILTPAQIGILPTLAASFYSGKRRTAQHFFF